MKTRLVDNWKGILTGAWSVRLMYIAGLLSAAEYGLQRVIDEGLVPPDGFLSGAAGIVSALAVIARIIAQPKLEAK